MGLFDPSTEGFLWVLAISLTVILIDVFLNSEFLSGIALLAVSVYFAALCDVTLKWQILLAIGCWLASCLFFFLIARKFLIPLVNIVIPKGHKESIFEAVGCLAEYRVINNEPMVSWNGDLWPVSNEDTNKFNDRDKVRIESVKNGIFTIKQGGE